MPFAEYAQSVVDYVSAHGEWAAPIVFVLAFGESLAFLSLIFPATVMLVGIGAAIGAADLPFWPIAFAAMAGALIGDAISYWIGWKYGHRLSGVWPFNKQPELLPRGARFFERWGTLSVFFGRFFGPIRAAITVVAGTFKMPLPKFALATLASAPIWAIGLLAPGALGVKFLFG
jgi:membrane protein DedA with SNARE-associated domain